MSILSREQILQASDIKTEMVSVPEWGGDVLVRGLTGDERDAFEASILVRKGRRRETDLTHLRAKLVVRACVDERGERIFKDDDAPRLARKSAAAIERIYDVAARLSGLGDDDMEELAKNSGSGQGDSSTSG